MATTCLPFRECDVSMFWFVYLCCFCFLLFNKGCKIKITSCHFIASLSIFELQGRLTSATFTPFVTITQVPQLKRIVSSIKLEEYNMKTAVFMLWHGVTVGTSIFCTYFVKWNQWIMDINATESLYCNCSSLFEHQNC